MNGEPAEIGQRIDPTSDVVVIDGIEIPLNPDLVTWLLYKPVGVISTMSDPQGRPTVRSLVPADPVTNPVGRLDLSSEGLLLMTNDGDLALRVTHPRYGIEKTYHVMIEGPVSPAQVNFLTSGIELDDGHARAKRSRIVDASQGRAIVEVTMTEGRKREIRRMFQTMGLEISRLVRTSIAGISDRTLSPGSHREVTPEEIRDIYARAKQDVEDG